MEWNTQVTNTSVISANILTVTLGYAFAARTIVYLEWYTNLSSFLSFRLSNTQFPSINRHILYVPALVVILLDFLVLYGPYNYGELYTSIINSLWYLSYHLEVLLEQFDEPAKIVSKITSLLS